MAHDTRPNALLWNRGGGRFEDVAERAGVAYDPNGRARAGMGIDVADLAGDGLPFLAIGNFAGEPLSFYRFDGRGFEDWSRRSGLEGTGLTAVTFGLAFLDADLDGEGDLVLANGHIEPEIHLFRPGQSHAQPARLFRGLGGGRFADASDAAGADFTAPRVGRGLSSGDLDGDGDLDLVLTQNGGRPAVLLNRAQELRPRHFLRVVLRGSGRNRDALGAVVTLEAGGRVQRRTGRTGSSYLSQGALAATFGLGEGAAVERLSVRWPGGKPCPTRCRPSTARWCSRPRRTHAPAVRAAGRRPFPASSPVRARARKPLAAPGLRAQARRGRRAARRMRDGRPSPRWRIDPRRKAG